MMKWRHFVAFDVLVSLSILATNISFAGLNHVLSISSEGFILQSNHLIEIGLRSELYEEYVKKPMELINKSAGRITLIYVDLQHVKELFINFDPNNLDKPFLAGNSGYPYTFEDYINFFRVLHQKGVKIVLAVWGKGISTKSELNFFTEYPNADIGDGTWVNPEYVDPSWNGKTFLQVYAEKIYDFTEFVGIPAIVSFEDWRYPGYLMQFPQLTQFATALKTLDSACEVWMPPASMCSARVSEYNAYKSDHAWAWEFDEATKIVGGSDILLTEISDVYHSALNVVGWMGGQMSNTNNKKMIIEKLYWGWRTSDYNRVQMKQKLKETILASYLTRIVSNEGEYCPVEGFVFVRGWWSTVDYTFDDILELSEYAIEMQYLTTVDVSGPILKIPRNLGYTTYPDGTSPIGGYMIGKGLIPFRFVHEDYVQYVDPSEKVVTHSGKDYSSEFGIVFDTTSQCTWLGLFHFGGQDYYAVFHDGGYESGIYDAEGIYQPADKISYKQDTTVSLNNFTLNIPADSVTVFDAYGNPAKL